MSVKNMKHMITLSLNVALTLTVISGVTLNLGCRPDSGPDDYASQEIIPDAAVPLELPLEDGEERFSLGVFYEGPFTEEVVIDDVSAHLYIYESTFSLSAVNADRVEGVSADRVRHAGGPWWGGGIHWEAPRDLSRWEMLHLSLKSSAESYERLEVAMNNSDTAQAKLSLSSYDWRVDGAWHNLEIPIQDFAEAGLDLTSVVAPLVIIGGSGDDGDELLIDAVYLSLR